MVSRKVILGGALPFDAQRAQQLASLANTFASSIILQDSRGTFRTCHGGLPGGASVSDFSVG